MSSHHLQAHLAQWWRAVQLPPRALRWPLHCLGRQVGSVEPSVFAALETGSGMTPAETSPLLLVKEQRSNTNKTLEIVCTHEHHDATLAQLATTLLRTGYCGPWRNECLPVMDECGYLWANVERGVVRVLGLRSQAVHLVGLRPDGHIWVQQRAFHKPNDPGLWDTLMGGTVAAGETVAHTLVRETWEEAGLHGSQLPPPVWGGRFTASRPVPDGHGTGYLVEDTHWYTVTIPNGVAPQNQDGEVDHFECWSPAQVLSALYADRFTPEARWVLAQVLQV